MPENIKKQYLRKTRKIGNSSGVLLPKALLGADVRVIVVKMPLNIKRDVTHILEPVLEEIIGVYLIKLEKHKAEILAVSTKIKKDLEKGDYHIDIVPLNVLKKSLKQNKLTKEKIKSAKPIINKKLLGELKREI